MAGRFPLGKPRLPAWALPLLAVSLTLILHAIWLVIPQPVIPEKTIEQGLRLYAYPNLDARTWSPTLFSLPSSLGFSGAIRQHASNVRPPLQSPVNLTGSQAVNLSEIFPEPGLQIPLALDTRLPVTVFPEAFSPDRTDAVYAWRLQVLEGPVSRLELSRLPPPPPGGGVVVLTGVMNFDALGQIESLFLDPVELSGGLREQVLRALRRARRPGANAPVRVRFRFAYLPSEERE